MTTEAGILLEQERLVDRLLKQRVEMCSKFRILCSAICLGTRTSV